MFNKPNKIIIILLILSLTLLAFVKDNKITKNTQIKREENKIKIDKSEEKITDNKDSHLYEEVSRTFRYKEQREIPYQDMSKYYPTSNDSRTLCFAGYVFDPLEGLSIDKNLLSEFKEGENYAIIQMTGPIYKEWRDEIESYNIIIFRYIPHYAYIVKVNYSVINKIQNLPFVRAIIPYHPALRISPTIGKHKLVGMDDRPMDGYRLTVCLFKDADGIQIEKRLGQLSRKVIDKTFEYHKRVVVDVDKGIEYEIAKINGVKWIEEKGEYFLFNYRHRQVVQTGALRNTKLYTFGLNGQNQIISIMDSGLDDGSGWFDDAGKVISNNAYGGGVVGYCHFSTFGIYSHGTHTTGTAAGNPSHKFKGVANLSKIVFQDIKPNDLSSCLSGSVYPPSDLTDAFTDALNGGAFIHSNSWGGSTNEYENYCVDVDEFIWDNPEFLIFAASGNTDGGASPSSISYFATAKSVVSVGATGMPNAQADSFDQRVSFSNYGPVYDGRIGPTLVNLSGAGIETDDTSLTWSCAGGESEGSILGMAGTSCAAPGAAGGALLVRQYYGRGFYPSGQSNPSDSIFPSGALIKATMVAGSDHLGNPVDNELGFGRINLDTALYFNGDTTKLQIRDCKNGLNTDTDSTYWIGVHYNTLPITAVLVWSDYPAAEGANPAIVNNLDLEVIDPSGNTYKGNHFSGGYTPSNSGSFDNLNTVEMVYIEPETYSTGDWQFVIHGENVPNGPQPFALVITGGVGATGNQPPKAPILVRIFDNAIFNAYPPPYVCTLSVKSTDLEDDDIQYQIYWDTDCTFGSPEQKTTSGSYTSGTEAQITIPLDVSDPETLYLWKARARDPMGSNNWSNWSVVRSFIMDMGIEDDWPYWYQISGEQFEQCTKRYVKIEGDSVLLGGPAAVPVDTIELGSVSDYCWGLTYDWERDGLWVGEFGSGNDWCYLIEKTSPCTKLDSFQFGSGSPAYHLGLGYAGSNLMYFAGHDGNIWRVDMTTGNCSNYRSCPGSWSDNQGLGFNNIDDVVYTGSWTTNQCAWAKPSQTGSWNTWNLSAPSGFSGAHSASTTPDWLFVVDENASGAKIYQHKLTNGVPNSTPDSIYDCDPAQSQESTGDCTFDGQYIYVLDQSDPDRVWVYDISTPGGGDGILYSPAISYQALRKEDSDRNHWDGVKWTKSSKEDSIGIKIEYKMGGNWYLIPDLGIGQQNGCVNSTGFFNMDNNICTVDLSMLGTMVYDTLRLRALIRTAPVPPKSSSNPALLMWALGNTKSNITGIKDKDKPLIFALNRVNPNPFINSTVIKYQIPKRVKVNLQVFDIVGRSVVNLVNKTQNPGYYSLQWRGVDKNNRGLPSGIYFLRMDAGDFQATQKMLFLR
jgi:hypothetical protein